MAASVAVIYLTRLGGGGGEGGGGIQQTRGEGHLPASEVEQWAVVVLVVMLVTLVMMLVVTVVVLESIITTSMLHWSIVPITSSYNFMIVKIKNF